MSRFGFFERNRVLAEEGSVLRHGLSTLLEHWAIALSGFALVFSGFGQMPMYKRYGVDRLPGLGWSSNFDLDLAVHLFAAAVFSFAFVYHAVLHFRGRRPDIAPRRGDAAESARIIGAMLRGAPEPPSGKFLAEQRLAYAFLLGTGLLLLLTGLVKALELLGAPFPHAFAQAATLLHLAATLLFLLGFAGHMAAFLIPANRPLLRSMFTRRVPLDYAARRHPLWIEEMRKDQEGTVSEGGAFPAEPGSGNG